MTSERDRRAVGVVLGALLTLTTATALVAVRGVVDNANIALALVLAVVVAARVGGRVGGITAAVVAALSFDFFHTRPYGSLTIDSSDDLETTVLLLGVALLVGALAVRGRRDRVEVDRAREEIRRVHRLAELAAGDFPVAVVLAATQDELTELLDLEVCRFEAADVVCDLPVLERSGALGGGRYRFAADGFELPADGVQLPVLARGRPVGRFVLVPRPGVGVSLERRVVAVALADQVGGLLVPVPLEGSHD